MNGAVDGSALFLSQKVSEGCETVEAAIMDSERRCGSGTVRAAQG
jgi:hypothetical protein